MRRRFNLVSFVEFYLHQPDKLEALTTEQKKYYWAQRTWHPVVRMNWVSLMESHGTGIIDFPDGSKIYYDPPHRVDKAA